MYTVTATIVFEQDCGETLTRTFTGRGYSMQSACSQIEEYIEIVEDELDCTVVNITTKVCYEKEMGRRYDYGG